MKIFVDIHQKLKEGFTRCRSLACNDSKKVFFFQDFHTVQGKKVYGLIVDPGAAAPLCGTQTLLEYAKHILEPHGLNFSRVQNEGPAHSFTGISGQEMKSKMKCSIPIGLKYFDTAFVADTIGGSGDRCPMLLANDSFVRMKLTLCANHFDNKDALLIVPHGDETYGLRCLLTDSGHYLPYTRIYQGILV